MKKISTYTTVSLLTLLMFVATNGVTVQAQTTTTTTTSQKTTQTREVQTQPMELPNVIIEGKEQLNVRGGIKQYPEKTRRLTDAELDSINPTQKLQALLLPMKTMPKIMINKEYKKGYLRGSIGNYTSANALGGYEYTKREYTFLGKAYLDYTDGHVKDSDHFGLGVDGKVIYIAPKKFWIFGGSKTTGTLKLDNYSYNMYGMDTAVDRNAFNFGLGIHSEGQYSGYSFKTGADLDVFSLKHSGKSKTDGSGEGFLNISKKFDNLEANALGDIEFHSNGGNSTNLLTFGAGVRFQPNDMSFDLNFAFQSAGSSESVERGNIKIDAGFDYRISPDFTVKVQLETGFIDADMQSLWLTNHFISNTPVIDYAFNKEIKGYLLYHPTQKLMVSGGVKIAATSRFAYFVPDEKNIYEVEYADANNIGLFAKAVYNLTDKDIVFGEFLLESRSFSEGDENNIPFIPKSTISAAYDRNWTDKFSSHVMLKYVGKRYADVENKIKMDPYLNAGIGVGYKVNSDFKIFANIDNLFNSEIYIWDKYKERDLFFNAGVLWHF